MTNKDVPARVFVGVTTKKQRIQIYITKTGKVRVFDCVLNKELK
jgi:hypothetical protein